MPGGMKVNAGRVNETFRTKAWGNLSGLTPGISGERRTTIIRAILWRESAACLCWAALLGGRFPSGIAGAEP